MNAQYDVSGPPAEVRGSRCTSPDETFVSVFPAAVTGYINGETTAESTNPMVAKLSRKARFILPSRQDNDDGSLYRRGRNIQYVRPEKFDKMTRNIISEFILCSNSAIIPLDCQIVLFEEELVEGNGFIPPDGRLAKVCLVERSNACSLY